MCFFFNDTATTEIYTLSLHDALPISGERDLVLRRREFLLEVHQHRVGAEFRVVLRHREQVADGPGETRLGLGLDRKSTRLNSSHANISYAVFCLKKKK